MAVSIGKRKRQHDDNGSNAGSEDESAMRALFQRAFEAKFKPLPPTEVPKHVDEQSEPEDIGEDSADSDEWDGLSDEDESVQIVSLNQSWSDSQLEHAQERRTFMSSKPPSSVEKPRVQSLATTITPEDDPKEAANLKNDLALQRLLKGSHLLDPSTFKGKVSAPEGKSRLKSLDLRLQDLGAKKSISEQQKMPLSHRKGIINKATSREEKRRQEAADNGVVLEKAKSTFKTARRRERSVGGPTVGKFNGGTLKLSTRDVKSIQGPKNRDSGGRKGRR